ncbi:MAG: UDP-N-acetylglucosamine 1-carboxyvinyltransferase [Oscillospiraceae bacterium]|nr:UDP-N-acetylglucosamine 1-carboxyvinyltransferase [Oscillospiraceae bacterium]
MSKYIIRGGKPLRGSVSISGAKNAAVAIIPAAVIADGLCRIENVPDIADVAVYFNILRRLGADVRSAGGGAFEIDAAGIASPVATSGDMQKLRASYYLIGALLARFGRADVAMPGGCNFGSPRQIDLHIKGLSAMGADINIKNGVITATTEGRLNGAYVFLDAPSVGATINIILAATTARGTTVIENAAREPHVVDLVTFLGLMGAEIYGAGTNTIRIHGKESLHGGSHAIITDQLEAGSFMAAAAATGGRVEISNVIPKHLECISGKLGEMGVSVRETGDSSVVVDGSGRRRSVDVTATPYPGFPTDMQPQAAVLLSLAEGTSTVTDNVFDTRFKYVDELVKMGASIKVVGRTAIIKGVPALTGAALKAGDLRAGAALVIAGLCARGTTEIDGVHYIERGYENMLVKLRSLGADITCDGGENDAAGYVAV